MNYRKQEKVHNWIVESDLYIDIIKNAKIKSWKVAGKEGCLMKLKCRKSEPNSRTLNQLKSLIKYIKTNLILNFWYYSEF